MTKQENTHGIKIELLREGWNGVYMGKVTDAPEANEDTCVCKKLMLYLFISDFSLRLVHRL